MTIVDQMFETSVRRGMSAPSYELLVLREWSAGREGAQEG